MWVSYFVVGLMGLVFYVSYFQEAQEAYLFPSIVSGVVLALAVLSAIRESLGLSADDFKPFPFLSQILALGVMVVLMLSAEWLGMYSSCFVALLLMSVWYSPHPDPVKKYTHSILFSIGFMACIYGLFGLLLNVQLPKGVLI